MIEFIKDSAALAAFLICVAGGIAALMGISALTFFAASHALGDWALLPTVVVALVCVAVAVNAWARLS